MKALDYAVRECPHDAMCGWGEGPCECVAAEAIEELAALRAENERLREALRGVLCHLDLGMGNTQDEQNDIDIARAALEKK